MLSTLLKIGKWQSQNKSQWDRFLEIPKVEYKDRNDNEIKNYILPIIFDLDGGDIIIDAANLEVYNEERVLKLFPIKVQGGNNKAIYGTVPAKKLVQIYKTFFGKENEETIEGELVEAVRKTNPDLLDNVFLPMLKEIFSLKEKFLEKLSVENETTGEKEISQKTISNLIKLSKNESIVVVSVKIKSQKYFQSSDPKPLIDVENYFKFLKEKYLGPETDENSTNKDKGVGRLCYASGKIENDVESLNLATRYSLNKMFVEETKNYATLFNDKLYSLNYQVSKENQEYLDYASDYFLNKGGHKVKIANIDHVIIPQFLSNDEIDFEMALSKIKSKSDLLFKLSRLENYSDNISDETLNTFWLNFIAFESDGNFFKSTEIIKDVSSFYFQKMLKTFIDVDFEFKENKNINWQKIMASYGQEGAFFNFNTIYQLIPVRKEKEKKNKALKLMKSILENRKVDKNLLFGYYCELLLCYYYERYKSYTNINPSEKDYLSFDLKKSTYKYLAFFEVLKKLNLIDMNEETQVNPVETGHKFDEAIKGFFEKMKLNMPQQAMFYLGRMLNRVEFIQIEKKIKKTVIVKVNFNGMDRDDIRRLRLSLIEKAKQHSKVGKIIFTDSKFGELFNYNQWNMNPQEAVFFLMTGYSFGISAKESADLENTESEEVEN